MSSLTEHLLTLSSHQNSSTTFQSATQTRFLRHAGLSKLPKPLLAQWLSQDRLYALAYVRFAARLLSKIRLEDENRSLGQGDKKHLSWRISVCLIGALQNIQREIEFFEDVNRRYDLGLVKNVEMAPSTKAYIALFDRIAGPDSEFLEGLVVLWATEKCYFEAWKYAASFLSTRQPAGGNNGAGSKDADGGALRNDFIPNWTNEGFGHFVGELEALVDELAELDAGKKEMKRCEEVWEEVLRLEERFWPVI
ncbi:MAG: hypothetical protein M1836_006805 [Candelina mexicana]|nr:MAG: hypothetical protein M1836_006805 [Candelina mexicana]